MIEPKPHAHSTALARSAARQLNSFSSPDRANSVQRKSAESRLPESHSGPRLTIHDLIELSERSPASQKPHVELGARGLVARAMARQSGLSLEQLRATIHRAAHRAHSPTVAATTQDTKLLTVPESSSQDDALNESIEYHTASASCRIDTLIAMCEDLGDSLPADAQTSLDALIVSLVARCLSRHPLFNATRSASSTEPIGVVNLSVAMRVADGWNMPVLHDAARRGIASIAQRLQALSGEHAFPRDAVTHVHDTFVLFNSHAQALDPARIPGPACGASLTIAPAPGGPPAGGARDDPGVPIVTLSVRVDSRLADSLFGEEFLRDLMAMFAEPRRALL